MRRRTFFRALGIAAFALIAITGILAALVFREPAGYRRAAVPAGDERRRLSGELQSAMFQMLPGNTPDSEWRESFSAEQINSYFAEDFLRARPFELPDGIHSPRVRLAPDRLELSFCYGEGFFSSVISIEMNAWLVAGEANTIAIEFLQSRAGLVPFSVRSLIERYLRTNRDWNVDVSWYRHNDHPVALVRIHVEPQRSPFVLQRLELQQDRLVIAGRLSEDAKVANLLP